MSKRVYEGHTSATINASSSCIFVTGASYVVDTDRSVSGLSLVNSLEPNSGVFSSRYNTFLGADSFIHISNTAEVEDTIDIEITDAGGSSDTITKTIPANGSIRFSFLESAISANGYGSVRVITDTGSKIISELQIYQTSRSGSNKFADSLSCR